jgi:dihydroceramidase
VVLSSITGGISVYYHYLQDPTFHQNAFALLTVGILFRSFYMMERYVRDLDPVSVNRMWKMVTWGVSIFLTGFGLWNLDNAYCTSLRSWRRDVGMPWGILSEGHGWWHLLTGCGAYYELVYGIYLRYCLDRRQNEYQLVWPSLFSLPSVKRWGPGERELFLAKQNGVMPQVNGDGRMNAKKRA